MIAISLEKDIEVGKMYVSGWYFVKKSDADKIKEKHPDHVIVDTDDIPENFYSNSGVFYYDGGQLVNSFGMFNRRV